MAVFPGHGRPGVTAGDSGRGNESAELRRTHPRQMVGRPFAFDEAGGPIACLRDIIFVEFDAFTKEAYNHEKPKPSRSEHVE